MKSNGTYVVIDIETTGFSPSKNEIIEIGAILVDENYNELSSFESFVKTPYIPPFITQLTGISARDTRDAPTLIEVLLLLSEFCGGAVPIAHYAPFDKKFIRHYLKETNTNFIETTWIDSINIFKQKYPGMPNYKLETLIREFNLATKEDHRALSDARHTLTLLKK